MKKDYDKSSFDAYMDSLREYLNEFKFEQEIYTSMILNEIDQLEVEVSSRPCYTNVEELMNAVKEM